MSLEELLSKLKRDEQGRLVLGDTPMMIIPREAYANLQRTAEEILGEAGAATLMYKFGADTAYNFAEAQARIFGLKGFEILEKYLHIASVRGLWSRCEIIEYSEEPLRVRVRLYNTTIADEFGPIGRAVCHVWRGAIAGIVKFIMESMGKHVEVRGKEVACIAKGDPYCEIIVEELGFR